MFQKSAGFCSPLSEGSYSYAPGLVGVKPSRQKYSANAWCSEYLSCTILLKSSQVVMYVCTVHIFIVLGITPWGSLHLPKLPYWGYPELCRLPATKLANIKYGIRKQATDETAKNTKRPYSVCSNFPTNGSVRCYSALSINLQAGEFPGKWHRCKT